MIREEILSDEQCNEFRRTPGSFNHMVRTIYQAGMDEAFKIVRELDQQAPDYDPHEPSFHDYQGE